MSPEEITFIPPRKPEPLLQELYWPDKWKVLVCCVMLNCTRRGQVDNVVETFFIRYPNAESYIKAYEWPLSKSDIIDLIKPLGFYNRRSLGLYKFSCDYISKQWSDPRELHGIGEYAARCYEILFLGKFGKTPPVDHALSDYWHWYMETHDKH